MQTQELSHALTLVIDAIENKTVIHDWKEPGQCNLGLVAQVLLKKSAAHILKVVASLGKEMSEAGDGDYTPTWTDLVNFFCPLSGLSNVEIIKVLQGAGMSRSDMIHLENLSDPEILKESGIQTKKIIKRGFFGKSKTEDIEDYYQKTDNFLKYLKAWRNMLNETY